MRMPSNKGKEFTAHARELLDDIEQAIDQEDRRYYRELVNDLIRTADALATIFWE